MNQELTDEEVQLFINNGFIKLEHVFTSQLAEQCRAILWNDTGCDPLNSSTWKQPVIRLGNYAQEPFQTIATSTRLHAAFDQIVGKSRWLPRNSLGTFPIRFPSDEEPNDTGWHVEASYPGKDFEDFLSWRINVHSKGRALLLLFLLSDVSALDAPTRIRVGSHLKVAQLLEPYGASGISFLELAEKLQVTKNCDEVLAVGETGTVYLCHPFLVHAAQPHKGSQPRFMAQPPLLPADDLPIDRTNGNYSAVEIAIRKGLGK